MEEIETFNKHMVCLHVASGKIAIGIPPREPMTKDEALLLAAWLVACTGEEEKFARVLKAVHG